LNKRLELQKVLGGAKKLAIGGINRVVDKN
jgi:hypothetical protein